ncbi:hypothetical protein IP88_08425 [alpha proteobacterium AAP81b]|nr:hypothetical protein IP88_08425 [alpha proteobacterium AAP81b]
MFDIDEDETTTAEQPDPAVDCLARTLAAATGACWEEMPSHPGYLRNYWREAAMHALRGPTARVAGGRA